MVGVTNDINSTFLDLSSQVASVSMLVLGEGAVPLCSFHSVSAQVAMQLATHSLSSFYGAQAHHPAFVSR